MPYPGVTGLCRMADAVIATLVQQMMVMAAVAVPTTSAGTTSNSQH